MIGQVLYNLTEPVLRPIRRFMPDLGGVDISPVVLLLGIIFIQMIIQNNLMPLFRGF
jgi:YggT family protein